MIIAKAQAEARQTIDAMTESAKGLVEITRDFSTLSNRLNFKEENAFANSRPRS